MTTDWPLPGSFRKTPMRYRRWLRRRIRRGKRAYQSVVPQPWSRAKREEPTR